MDVWVVTFTPTSPTSLKNPVTKSDLSIVKPVSSVDWSDQLIRISEEESTVALRLFGVPLGTTAAGVVICRTGDE